MLPELEMTELKMCALNVNVSFRFVLNETNINKPNITETYETKQNSIETWATKL